MILTCLKIGPRIYSCWRCKPVVGSRGANAGDQAICKYLQMSLIVGNTVLKRDWLPSRCLSVCRLAMHIFKRRAPPQAVWMIPPSPPRSALTCLICCFDQKVCVMHLRMFYVCCSHQKRQLSAGNLPCPLVPAKKPRLHALVWMISLALPGQQLSSDVNNLLLGACRSMVSIGELVFKQVASTHLLCLHG